MPKKFDHLSSAELVSEILTNTQGAEDQLIHRYSDGLKFIIRRKVSSVEDAEDIIQETLKITLCKIRDGKLHHPEKLTAFIQQTARFTVIDYHRKRKRHDIVGGEALDDVADNRYAPDQILDKLDLKIAVSSILTELKHPRDIEILQRYHIDGESKEVICSDLGLTTLHFNRVIYRARQRFKVLWLQQVGANFDNDI